MLKHNLLRETRLLPATPEAIREAAGILRRGGLVALPTETVYGLGGDAENPDAVRAIFAAKGRPADHPVIIHVMGAADLDAWAVEVPDYAQALAERFWPGPLTIVLPKKACVPDIVTSGLPTVAVRMSSHPVFKRISHALGKPIAAPSANRATSWRSWTER